MNIDGASTKEMVNEHWRYTSGIIELAFENREMITKRETLKMMEYLYIKAMLHGIKHGLQGEPLV